MNWKGETLRFISVDKGSFNFSFISCPVCRVDISGSEIFANITTCGISFLPDCILILYCQYVEHTIRYDEF